MTIKEIEKKLPEVKEIAKVNNLSKLMDYLNQVEYMVKTYKGTVHEAEVAEMISKVLGKF